MTTSIWIDPTKPEILNSLQPTPGYCIFIDIVGSAKLKSQGIHNWIAGIHNSFGNTRLLLSPFQPLKSMGDALMYYIEVADLEEHRYTPTDLFTFLWEIGGETDPRIPAVRIGAARCEQAYAVTFFQGHQDYYGIDIDMTARLQKLAENHEIVIERRLYDEVSALYYASNGVHSTAFLSLLGPTREDLEGIPSPVEVFRCKAA